MPRTCTVCSHKAKGEIDAALVASESLRDIARRYATTKDALGRHRAHLPKALTTAHGAAEVARGDTLLDQVQDLQKRSLAVLKKAEDAGDLRSAIGAIAQARGNLELLARMVGELKTQQTTINIHVSAEWKQVRTTIIAALMPYPDASAAVVAALAEPASVDAG